MFDFLFKVVVGNEKKYTATIKRHTEFAIFHFTWRTVHITEMSVMECAFIPSNVSSFIFVGNIESKMWLLLGIFASIDDY